MAKPAPPIGGEEAAEAVLAAVRAKDAAGLARLGAKDDPDPWFVVDELIRRGEFDAAEAFAKVAPRADTEGLPAYIASRRSRPEDPARRARLAAVSAALVAGRLAEAVDLPGPAEPAPIEDVVGVRLQTGLGNAHQGLGALEKASVAFLAAAEAAERLGWLARASLALDRAGGSAFVRGAPRVALDAWARQVTVCERRGDRAGRAVALAGVGHAALQLDDAARALPALETALAEGTDLSMWSGADSVRYHVGLALGALGDLAKARRTFEGLLRPLEASGERALLADALCRLAEVDERAGAHEQAAASWARAVPLRETLGDPRTTAWTLTRLGAAQDTIGARKDARASLERALGIYEGLGSPPGTGVTLLSLGQVLFASGELAPSAAAIERAIVALEAQGEPAGVAEALTAAGCAHHALGDYPRAKARFERALAFYEATGDRSHTALALENLGNVHGSMGDLATAVARLERAIALREADGDPGGARSTLLHLGEVLSSRDEFARAVSTFERALAMCEAAGDRPGAARALALLGVAQSRRGDLSTAIATLERAAAAYGALGSEGAVADTRGRIGRVHLMAGEFAKAIPELERARAAAEASGDRAEAARMLGDLGLAHKELGAYAEALAALERAFAAGEALGDEEIVRKTRDEIGGVHFARGDYAQALAIWEPSAAAHLARGAKADAASALSNVGAVYLALGEFPKARSSFERALALHEAVGARLEAAVTLGNLGIVDGALGDLRQALATYERARAAHAAIGSKANEAAALDLVGGVHVSLGDHAKAMACYERARAMREATGDRVGIVESTARMAAVRATIGDHAAALAMFERVRAMYEAMGDKLGVATTARQIGWVRRHAGDAAGAKPVLEEALAAFDALGHKAGVADARSLLGAVQAKLGDPATALATLEQARAGYEALGARLDVAAVRVEIGAVHEALGDTAKALGAFEGALAASEAIGDRMGAASALGGLAGTYGRAGEHGKAIDFARRATLASAGFARGLGAEEGVVARSRLAGVCEVGARAAVASNDTAALLFFLESGRAGALLEGLNAREALWAAAVPAEARAEEAKARVAEAAAVKALSAAIDEGALSRIRARRAELDAARARTADVIARIQRDAKAGASLVYPQAATLEEVQATLAEGDALVLYALFEADAAALVLTRDGARIVPLGPTARISEAISGLALGEAGGDAVEASARVAALATLVVKPLALGPSAKRVLVSPTGGLSYVPFAPLLPDVTVACAPSGTTHRFLRGDVAARGEGVLALGDPAYDGTSDAPSPLRGGQRLVRLPGTRDEALALGTRVLLGADATEAGLRAALGTKRWRAIHLACHGLVDAERPAFSSLALTPGAADDGFLTALEVFRARMPADLVVLSACETGRGKFVEGEGLVGLTRAFMFAGAPRVICSLWKVDDEATRALMTRFYELWSPKDGKPGLPTAEALAKAQEHVRSQERWKHPYYWAAWVLWGLPE